LYYAVSCGLEGLPEEVEIGEDVAELAIKVVAMELGERG